MGKSVYGTQYVSNITESGSSTGESPSYFIDNAKTAFQRLLTKNISKMAMNNLLENYRQEIAIQTETTYVPTILNPAIAGVTTIQNNDKIDLTTDATGNSQGGIIIN
jgi:hypothetical protein